jgi:hypothetical protein
MNDLKRCVYICNASHYIYVYRVKKKFSYDNSHCYIVHIVCLITLKPITLDFSGHVLSSSAIDSEKNNLKIVIIQDRPGEFPHLAHLLLKCP